MVQGKNCMVRKKHSPYPHKSHVQYVIISFRVETEAPLNVLSVKILERKSLHNFFLPKQLFFVAVLQVYCVVF